MAHNIDADIIAVVDDDIVSLGTWGKNVLTGSATEVTQCEINLPAFDAVGATNYRHLWHRGLRLQVPSTRDYSVKIVRETPDIQADFWNGDPDVDAVCRMAYAPQCNVDPARFPLSTNRMTSFNSKNTFISHRTLKNYYLIPHLGRTDDIRASFHLQAKQNTVVYVRQVCIRTGMRTIS